MHSTTRTLASLGTGLLGVISLIYAAPVQTQSPVFRAGVDYVSLDVVATDTSGRLIRDLARDDFILTEGGRPQEIAGFQYVAHSVQRRPIANVEEIAPVIDTVSNAHAVDARQWVLVIDDLHIVETFIVHTQRIVEAFLTSLTRDDQVAIVFVGRSDLSQGFTSDLSAQLRTVRRIPIALGFAPDAADDVDSRTRHRMAGATADVLKNIATSLSRSTFARKALVYVGEGMTYDRSRASYRSRLDLPLEVVQMRDVFEQLEGAFVRLREAGVPVYSIDPRGIPDCDAVRGPCAAPPYGNIRAQQRMLQEFAENTGGLAFVKRSDTLQAVQQLVEDNSGYYILGYYPNPFRRDGKFHNVSVAVRRPGVEVRARAGYLAPRGTLTERDVKPLVEQLLGGALAGGDLSLRGLAAPVRPAAGGGMRTAIVVTVTCRLPAGQDRLKDTLQLGIAAIDSDGNVKAAARKAFQMAGASRAGATIVFAVNEIVDLPSQTLTVRVAIASQALGQAGVIHIPVEVIDPLRSHVQLPAVVIAFDGAPRISAIPPQLLGDLLPVQPTTAREFSPSDTLRIVVPLVAGGQPTAPLAKVDVSIRQGQRSYRTVPAEIAMLPAVGTVQQAQASLAMPLAGLSPGTYELSVKAMDPAGATATRTVSFSIR
jgi:VWFA-related protein